MPTADRINPPLLEYGNDWQKRPDYVRYGDYGVDVKNIDKGELQNCLDRLRYSS